jgi:hypothetical protein
MSLALRCLPLAALAVALAAAASAAVAQAPLVVQGFECRGDDPAWRLDATRAAATYSSAGPKAKRAVVFRGSLQSLASLAPQAVVWRGDTTHLPRETLVVTLREEACKPAAADAPALTHRAVLSLKAGEALTGCCTVRMGPLAPAAPGKRTP